MPNDPKFQIRPYEPADAAAASALLARLQGIVREVDALEQFIPQNEFDSAAYLESQLALTAKYEGIFRVAVDQTGVVGVVVGWIKRPDPATKPVELIPKNIAYIADLVVGARSAGAGVGTALLASAERHFIGAGCDYVALSTMARNEAARGFYGKKGYEDYSVRMVKKLR